MTTKVEEVVAAATAAAAAPRMSFWPSFGDISTEYCSAARRKTRILCTVLASLSSNGNVLVFGRGSRTCARCDVRTFQ